MTRTALYPLLFVSILFAGAPLCAQEKNAPPDQAEMMRRWQEYMTPGEEHEAFARMAGTWTMKSEIWMQGPGTEASVSTGTAVFSMDMDGRYLVQRVEATMMGMPFRGVGYTGYDNFKKKYVSTWLDNMGTGISTMEGTRSADGKSIVLWGVMDEPVTGEKDKKVKYVTTFVDENTHVFEVYDVTTYGEKAPVMRHTYKRK